jgi:hypothetical protein
VTVTEDVEATVPVPDTVTAVVGIGVFALLVDTFVAVLAGRGVGDFLVTGVDLGRLVLVGGFPTSSLLR